MENNIFWATPETEAEYKKLIALLDAGTTPAIKTIHTSGYELSEKFLYNVYSYNKSEDLIMRDDKDVLVWEVFFRMTPEQATYNKSIAIPEYSDGSGNFTNTYFETHDPDTDGNYYDSMFISSDEPNVSIKVLDGENSFWNNYTEVQSQYTSYVDFLEKSLKKWISPSKPPETIELLGIHPSSIFHKKNFKADKFSDYGKNMYKNLQLLKFPITAKIVEYKSEHQNCPLIVIPDFPIFCDFTVTHFLIEDEKQRKIWAKAEDGSI